MKRRKSEATQRHILDTALGLFRRRGFEATTMRDIARAAGLSLGAAYYYFPSKEAIVLAYYARQQSEHEARVRVLLAGARDLRERLAAVLHSKLDLLDQDRRLLGALFKSVGDPTDPLSVFGARTRAVRQHSMTIFAQALGDAPLPSELRAVAPAMLWLLHLGILLHFIHDDSPGQARTRQLVDAVADLLAQLAPLAGRPGAQPVWARLFELVQRFVA